MTIDKLYNTLQDRLFYEKNSRKRYRFKDNSLFIDRKAEVPFVLYMEEDRTYLSAQLLSETEQDFLVEIDDHSASIHFYEKCSGKEMCILE